MASSYFTPPESIIDAPSTLSTYSTLKGSSHTIPNKCNIDVEKQQAIQRKIQLLMLKFKPVPFVPSKNLDFSKHEYMFKMLGLWDFAHIEFDKGVRVDLIAELIASYDPKFQCSYVNGVRITVNRAHLACVMKLHMKKSNVLELDLKKDSMEFIVDFLLNWVLLHGGKGLLPVEVLNWVKVIRDKHPEKLDWAGLLWFMVEKELSQGVNLEDCFYASHLQLLIKSQCDKVFLKGETEKMELYELRKTHREEIKKKDEEILRLEHELSENRELVERYKEALEEMHKVVEECKKIFDLPEKSLEKTETREIPEESLEKTETREISEEAICEDDEGGDNKSLRIESNPECKKKFRGVYHRASGSWQCEISSSKLNTRIWLGTYHSAEAAARAYDAANFCLKGSKAILNFPISSSIAHLLSPDDSVMSVEAIKKIAAEAAAKYSEEEQVI